MGDFCCRYASAIALHRLIAFHRLFDLQGCRLLELCPSPPFGYPSPPLRRHPSVATLSCSVASLLISSYFSGCLVATPQALYYRCSLCRRRHVQDELQGGLPLKMIGLYYKWYQRLVAGACGALFRYAVFVATFAIY